MIRINLLPYREARKRENIRRKVGIFFLAVILVFGILLFYRMRLNQKIDGLNTQIKHKKTTLVQVEKQAKQVDRIKDALAKLQKKTTVIKGLEGHRKASIDLFENMTEMVAEKTSSPPSETSTDSENKPVKRLWFTRFEAKKDNININGIALDNKTVADFMSRLETSKRYVNVNLKTLKQQKVNNLNLKSFEINCTKVSADSSKEIK